MGMGKGTGRGGKRPGAGRPRKTPKPPIDAVPHAVGRHSPVDLTRELAAIAKGERANQTIFYELRDGEEVEVGRRLDYRQADRLAAMRLLLDAETARNAAPHVNPQLLEDVYTALRATP